MSKRKEKKLYKRKWLNDTDGTAYIVIDMSTETLTDGSTSLYGVLEIKDCNRQAAIEFWCDGEKDFKLRLKKLARIRKAVNELEAFMLANPPRKAPKKPKSSDPKKVAKMVDNALEKLTDGNS